MDVMSISERELPLAKYILPFKEMSCCLGIAFISASMSAEKFKLVPNTLLITLSRDEPPVPSCACTGSSPRQRIVKAQMETYFFMDDDVFLFACEWPRSRKKTSGNNSITASFNGDFAGFGPYHWLLARKCYKRA